MALQSLLGPKGAVSAIEYCCAPAGPKSSPVAFALLLPGTSIRPGPGADKAHKYRFEPGLSSIYETVALRLSRECRMPCLQLCWRHFPADGGTTFDAVHDILAGIAFMRKKYGKQCGAFLVGYSFGGAAILQLLAQCAAKPEGASFPLAGKQSWLLGCIHLSGALKGKHDDVVNLFDALKYVESAQVPLLIVHGSEDDNVAVSAAHKLYRRSCGMKTLCMLHGADHDLRDVFWRDLVADVCSQWLAQASVPRGTSVTSRARAIQQAHHAGAAALSSIAAGSSSMGLAMEPPPQRPGGGALPYPVYEVPSAASESLASGASDVDPLPFAQRNSRLVEMCASHAERQRKARERASRERGGSLKEAYAKLQASRARRASTLTCGPHAPRSTESFGTESPHEVHTLPDDETV